MKKEIKGYIVLGMLILLTVVALLGLKNKNEGKEKDNTDVSQNQTENQNIDETRKLRPNEKYLYADIEDPTYADVIRTEFGYVMSKEGFKKYNIGKMGDKITVIDRLCEVGKEIEMDKVTQFYVKVTSFDTYESYEELENSIEDSQKLINLLDNGEGLRRLDEDCVYATVKFSLSSNLEKMTAYDTSILNVYQIKEDEKNLYAENLPGDKWEKYAHPHGYIFDKETMFAQNVGINGATFKYQMIGKDIKYMSGIEDVVIPPGKTVEVIHVYEVPKDIITSERLVFGSFLYADDIRTNDEFSIYLNK